MTKCKIIWILGWNISYLVVLIPFKEDVGIVNSNHGDDK